MICVPICLLFFFFPLQTKFSLRRDDDQTKDIFRFFIITWRSVREHYCQDNCEPWGDHFSDRVGKTPPLDRDSIRFSFNKDYIRVGLIFYGHGIAPCKQEAAAWCRQLSVIVTCLGVSETERGRDWGRRHGAEQAVESEPGAGTQVRQRHLMVTLTIENPEKLIVITREWKRESVIKGWFNRIM